MAVGVRCDNRHRNRRRRLDDGPRNRHSLLLSAGQFTRPPMLHATEAEFLEQCQRA